jgi:hypothetical protein
VLPCFTAAFPYGIEARSYGLMLGLFTLTLVAWSEAAAFRRRALYLPLLGVLIAAGLWNHYYAALVLVPIGAGEIVRLAENRRVDWQLWLAVALGGAAAAPLLPLARIAGSYSATYWRHASYRDIPDTNAFLFGPLAEHPVLVIGAAVMALIVFGSRVGTRIRLHAPGWRATDSRSLAAADARDCPPHEVAALLACLVVPVAAVLAGLYSAGVFVPRYALTGVVGFALAIPLLVARMPTRRVGDFLLCAILLSAFGRSAYAALSSPAAFKSPIAQRQALLRQLDDPEPIVVTSGLIYLQLWYYTPPAERDRLIYIADPALAMRYTGSDTIDRNLLALRRWTDVSVDEVDFLQPAGKQFALYRAGTGWLPQRLADLGASVEPVAVDPGGTLSNVVLR